MALFTLKTLKKLAGYSRQTSSSRRPAQARLFVEALEERTLMSADWFSTYLPNANIAALARNDWYNHGAVNYNDMLKIYGQVEKSGPVTYSEFTSLQNLSYYATALHTPDSVRYLETQVASHISVGSSAGQLQGLVGNWFLGQNHPWVASGQGIYYAPVSGNLFGAGGPTYTDIAQGGAGDCVLLSSLAVTAAHDNSAIQNMFTYDGNNVWTVRFYMSGAPVYVTVDNMLPMQNGQTYYDHPLNGVLWAALAEKAYGELNAFDSQDGYASNFRGLSSYTNATEGFNPNQVLTTLTGYSSSIGSVAQGLSQGALLVLGTGSNSGSPYIVADHEYAVISYNATTKMYTLFNPWGVNAMQQYGVWGLVNANAAYLETYFTAGTAWITAPPTLPAGSGAAGHFTTTVTATPPTTAPTTNTPPASGTFTATGTPAPGTGSNTTVAGLGTTGQQTPTGDLAALDKVFAQDGTLGTLES